MVAEEFLKLAGQFKLTTYVGIDDFADKLSFMYSVVFILLSLMIVTIKSYYFKPLACYIATNPSGLNFDNYLENFCWVHGTIAILPGEKIPQTPVGWRDADEKRITYYQWVPFILGLQCIMFYIPRIVWQIICYTNNGTDLEGLINDASKASNTTPGERKGTVEHLSRLIEDMLFQHRDYRQGKMANIRRKVYNYGNFYIFSKHLGTWLVMSYMFVKALYCLNVLGQLFIMKKFLGHDESFASFGYHLLRNISQGREWDQTGIFPRVTYCYIDEIRHLGASNKYVAQCALPINMLSEKIYIFLWFWMWIVLICTAISIPMWILRIAYPKNSNHLIKRFLAMSDNYERSDKPLMKHFIREFLRHDGMFLIRMMLLNAGDLITSDVVLKLWEIYKEQYKNIDFRNSNIYERSNDLEISRKKVPEINDSDGSISKAHFV